MAVDFIVAAAGGPTIYLGRDMKMSHKGMGITKADYAAFMRCLSDTLNTFEVPEPERSEVVTFATSLEPEIVEAYHAFAGGWSRQAHSHQSVARYQHAIRIDNRADPFMLAHAGHRSRTDCAGWMD